MLDNYEIKETLEELKNQIEKGKTVIHLLYKDMFEDEYSANEIAMMWDYFISYLEDFLIKNYHNQYAYLITHYNISVATVDTIDKLTGKSHWKVC